MCAELCKRRRERKTFLSTTRGEREGNSSARWRDAFGAFGCRNLAETSGSVLRAPGRPTAGPGRVCCTVVETRRLRRISDEIHQRPGLPYSPPLAIHAEAKQPNPCHIALMLLFSQIPGAKFANVVAASFSSSLAFSFDCRRGRECVTHTHSLASTGSQRRSPRFLLVHLYKSSSLSYCTIYGRGLSCAP